MIPELEEIGYISKPKGFKGALRLELSVEPLDLNDFPPFVWIYFEGKPVPFKVDECNLHVRPFVLKLEDINSEETAKPFANNGVFVEQKLLENFFENPEELSNIISYKVIDENDGEIGVIEEIITNTKQPILSILFKGKEIMLPYTEETILSIDNKSETVHVKCPTGLIAMYLES